MNHVDLMKMKSEFSDVFEFSFFVMYLDLRYGCLLEEFRGRFDAAKKEIIKLCSKYDVDSPDNTESVTEDHLSDIEEDISEADRLRKRRRLSGDTYHLQSRKRNK